MKKIISILVFSILITGCKSDQKQEPSRDGYIIEGNAPGIYNGIRAYLEVTSDRGRKVAMDTAIVMNEKFVFEGKSGTDSDFEAEIFTWSKITKEFI